TVLWTLPSKPPNRELSASRHTLIICGVKREGFQRLPSPILGPSFDEVGLFSRHSAGAVGGGPHVPVFVGSGSSCRVRRSYGAGSCGCTQRWPWPPGVCLVGSTPLRYSNSGVTHQLWGSATELPISTFCGVLGDLPGSW